MSATIVTYDDHLGAIMTKPRFLILDADGVVVRPPQPYSQLRAGELGVDPATFLPFFQGPFQSALVGRADLCDLIAQYHELWQWERPFEELIAAWCESENHPDPQIIKLIAETRAAGVPVYLATNQERHRTTYLRDVMFKDVFDGILASCDLHHLKYEPAFWMETLHRLRFAQPNLESHDIAFFDDDRGCVTAARAAGLRAHLYQDAAQIARVLAG